MVRKKSRVKEATMIDGKDGTVEAPPVPARPEEPDEMETLALDEIHDNTNKDVQNG